MTLFETLRWYLENVLDYTAQMLPCMCGALILYLLMLPSRKRRLEEKNLVSPLCREGALLLLFMYCAGLAALTLFPANFWRLDRWRAVLQGVKPLFPAVDLPLRLRSVQLTLFQEIRRAFKGPWVMFLMLGNIGMFLPVGLLPALLWRKPRWWKALLTGFLTSFFIEFIQFFIGRNSDIDDVLLNTMGALLGYWLFRLLGALWPNAVSKFQCHERGVP